MRDKISTVFSAAVSCMGLIGRKLIGCRVNFVSIGLVSISANIRTFGRGRVILGQRPEIRPHTEITARNGKISIGNRCFINRNCVIAAHESIEIQDGVTIGPGTYIYDHDHDGKEGFVSKPVVIGEGAWIGANVVILKGVSIGKNAVIAAGTVVTKDIPEGITYLQKRQGVMLQNEQGRVMNGENLDCDEHQVSQ